MLGYKDNEVDPKSATIPYTEITAGASQNGSKPAPRGKRGFARICADVSELILNLTPCAKSLYTWLLQQRRSGQVQEVHLIDFAESTSNRRRGAYSMAHVRRSLNELLDSELVELVYRYSGKVFKLIAHDSRTFSSNNPTEILDNATEMLEKSTSKVDSGVGLNKRDQFKTADIPTHPPVKNEPEEGFIVQKNYSEVIVQDCSTEVGRSDAKGILQEVETALGQPLNPNIQHLLLQHTLTRLRDALDSYREAQQQDSVIRNPVGWFVAAVQRAYKPNRTARQGAESVGSSSGRSGGQAEGTALSLPEGFEEWFGVAKQVRVAVGSTYRAGELHVYTLDSLVPWVELRQVWPLEKLQQLIAKPLPERSVLEAKPVDESVSGSVPAVEMKDPEVRAGMLARLRAKFLVKGLREEAIEMARVWGFEVRETGIFEGASG